MHYHKSIYIIKIFQKKKKRKRKKYIIYVPVLNLYVENIRKLKVIICESYNRMKTYKIDSIYCLIFAFILLQV